MAGAGTKQELQNLLNIWKIKADYSPALIIKKLQDIINVIEDAYSVATPTELQEAVDNIGDEAGTIFIASGTYDITTPIDLDGCGSLIVYGHGDNTILKPADGVTVFNITCCASLVIKTLKIDLSNYTFLNPNDPAILVNETNNNICGFNDVTIVGDGSNGIGIELQSDNCIVEHCNISLINKGIYINNSDTHTIVNNPITSCDDYGIWVNTANYCNISHNICNSNENYGIYLDTVTYSIIAGNICNSNEETGIYATGCSYLTFSSNSCGLNEENGIYLTGCSYNTISSNTLSDNDSNSLTAKAGLYITSNSDFNTITANSVNNNNNSGIGTGYGILIATATCDENVVAGNNANGNDVDYLDSGTATTVEYYVQNTDELQDAIDSIGSKAGIVNIDSSFTVSTTIDIDGNGSYIIQGEGSNSTLTTVGDINCFNIDTARQVIMKNFKINASSLTTPTREIIDINEDSNNIVVLDNIIITGDGTNGYGIELNSNNCRINDCTIDNVNIGINIKSKYNIIEGNNCNNCASYGFNIDSEDYNTLSENISDSNQYGIGITSGDYNTLSTNTIIANTLNGIYIVGTLLSNSDYNAITANNCVGNDSNTANPQAGIYIDDYTDNTTIVGNTSISNNNSGAGIGYGIYIANSRCDSTVIQSNNNTGNDVNYWDLGSNTDIIYRCTTGQEIQDAINSIAAKSGTIKIATGTIALSATIDVDGGGDYIIEGGGDGTILDCAADRTCFNITSAKTCILREFKIDATDLTTDTKEIIDITEGSDNKVIIENITITGDGTNGYGIEINSDYCSVIHCNIDNINEGIVINTGDFNTISENNINNNTIGIHVEASNSVSIADNIISSNSSYGYQETEFGGSVAKSFVKDNTFSSNGIGIVIGSDDGFISGNIIYGCTLNGIELSGASNNNNIANNSISNNNSNTANTQAAIYLNANCDRNVINGNTIINNNNAGAGTTYGISVAALCDDNIIKGNSISGNDVQWLDNGANTQIEYLCSTAQDIQDAIDSIAAKSGTIKIVTGTITLSATIDVDGGGDYIIEGGGVGTVLDCGANRSCFNITSATSCVIRNLKIDANDLTLDIQPIININEAADNKVVINNVFISGDGTNGHGVHIMSNSCDILNCTIDNIYSGIYAVSITNAIISGNNCSLCADNGLYINICSDSMITNNLCDNTNYGIEIDNCNYTLISDNVYNNSDYGILITTSEDCSISGNSCNGNDRCGIVITNSSNNSIIGNICNGNNTNSASNGAGIWIDSTSDNNIITGNNCYGNANAGAGIAYGIYIGNANCDDNIIKGNNISGNDVQWKDLGTNTQIEYFCITAQDIQDAIDSIATKSGTIKIATGTIALSATIDVDGGGDYIIEGGGVGTILDCGGNRTVLNITSVNSCIVRNIKIDLIAYTANIYKGIDCNEASNNVVLIDNISILGDGTNGKGIHIQSDNVEVKSCIIDSCYLGITAEGKCNIHHNFIDNSGGDHGIGLGVGSDGTIVVGNTSTNSIYGILIASGENVVSGNFFNNNDGWGIQIRNVDYNTITGNVCNSNATNYAVNGAGIWLAVGASYNTIIGNSCNLCINVGAGNGYGIYIEATCDYNIIKNNIFSGNDVQWKDLGTNTQIEYICTTAQDIQDAIDSIAAKSGTIKIVTGNIVLSATIDIDGGGDYLIEGGGAGTIIDIGGDYAAFDITSCKSCTIENLAIDGNSLTTAARRIIDINETNDNVIFIESLKIYGDTVNGRGIYVASENVIIEDCIIYDVKYGIYINANNCNIRNNTTYNCAASGILTNASYSNISTNITYSNTSYGLQIEGSNCTISDNISYDNTDSGIYLTAANNNSLVGNNSFSNPVGIELEASCDNNVISSNVCESNDTNNATSYGGIQLGTNNDENNIIGNSIINNNNAGAGITYGIYITNANCNDNIIVNNSISGNDIQWKDIGTNTQIEYICTTAQDIQDAIDSIAAKSGTITIATGTIALSATIDVDGGGDYIIEGGGDGTVLDCAADRKCFDVTSTTFCIIRNLKIDANDLTTATKEIVDISEASNNKVIIENINITGDSSNGYGIEINSGNCIIRNCRIDNINHGVVCFSTYTIIEGNSIQNNAGIGIYLNASVYNLVKNNTISGNNLYGIGLDNGSNINIINGNSIIGSNLNSAADGGAIFLVGTSDNNVITDNTCYGNVNAGAGTAYGIYIGNANCDTNIIGQNFLGSNDTDYLDNGTGTVLFGDDTAYGAGWNGDLGTATKKAIWDKIETIGGDAFKTITGITNDVVADAAADTLTLASADAKLTIVGTAATDTITFTIVPAQIGLNDLGATSLADPGADRIVFWDETDNQFEFLVANTGLSIAGNNLNCDITYAGAITAIKAADPVAITGSWNFDIDSGNKKFYITRSGNANQGLEIWVDDTQIYFTYAQDEVAAHSHNVIFDIISGASGDHNYDFKINTVSHFKISDNGLDATVPLAMGANKITGLANGAAGTDAMAFGQKYTDANARAAVSLDNAFDIGKIINGANSLANAVQIGDGANEINIYELAGNCYITSSASLRLCANGDIDDYINISSSGTLVTMDFVGGVGNITDVNNIDCSNVRHDGDLDNERSFGADTQDFRTANVSRMDISNSGVRFGAADARITEFDSDVNLAGGNTKVPTSLAAKTYADTKCTTAEAHAYVEANAMTITQDLILGANQKGIVFNDEQVTDEYYNGIIITQQVDQNTQGFGNLLHMDTDGNYIDADANVEADMPCSAMALASGTGAKRVMLYGYVCDTAWNWTPGQLLWVSATSGDITATKPSTTGHFVQCVGIAIHADTMFFNPQYEYFELS